jgi:hypothetical protein
MIRSWLPLLAAVCVLASRGTAAAQTVVVRHVPAKAAVQIIVGDAAPVAAVQDADGNFRATINAIPAGSTEISAQVFVDTCEASVRIVLTNVGAEASQPTAGVNCLRRQPISGTYVVRSRTSLVVDLSGETPKLLTSQGPAPNLWLHDAAVESRPAGATPATGEPAAPAAPATNYAPTGLIVFGTGNISNYRTYGQSDCTSTAAASCTIKNTVWAGSVGLEYWVSPYIGAFGSLSKERPATTSGDGGTYRFSSELDTDFATAGLEGRLPAGRVTIFGTVGATHHRATWTTVNTVDDSTVTVNGVAQTLSGGTETWIVKTQGWHLAFGGGADIWVTKRLGIRGGIDYAIFQGNDLGGSQAKIDDSMLSAKFGVVFKIGKF